MIKLLVKLQRRNVFRVGAAYVVMAWLLAQVADLVLDNFPAPDWIMQAILLLLAIGFPVAVLLAWAFELTPEGLRREKELDEGESIPPRAGRGLNLVIIALLMLAVAFFAFDRFARVEETAPPGADRRSVAVIPFENMSRDEANDPFTIGIHDDLLTHLSRIASLKTISRTSVRSASGQVASSASSSAGSGRRDSTTRSAASNSRALSRRLRSMLAEKPATDTTAATPAARQTTKKSSRRTEPRDSRSIVRAYNDSFTASAHGGAPARREPPARRAGGSSGWRVP